MNRIVLKYKPRNEEKQTLSQLEVYDDIKGYDFQQIDKTFFGIEADMMFELLKNVDYDKLDNYILYDVVIVGEEND